MSRIAAESMIPIYGDEAMKVKPSPIKCDVEESCEQSDTCVDDSGVGDKVTDMTKYDVLDSCEHSDTCVNNCGIRHVTVPLATRILIANVRHIGVSNICVINLVYFKMQV